MHLLIASLAALFLGPVLLRLLGRRGPLLAAIDGFVVVGLGGVLVGHLLPDSLAIAGVWAGVLAALGVVTPPLLERGFSQRSASISAAVISLAMLGLALHAMMDGAALALALQHGARQLHEQSSQGGALAIAVMLHRIPIGLTIWWLVGRAKHARRGWMMLAVVTVATAAGFFGAQPLLDAMPTRGLALAQALLAGLLFHAVFAHRPDALASDTPQPRRWALLGAALAAAALLYVGGHQHHEPVAGTLSFAATMTTLALHSAPALLLAFVAAGVLMGAVTTRERRRLGAAGALSQALRGSVYGVPMQVCSCGVVPVYRELVQRGVPITAALAFLVATPAIGMDAIWISVPMLGPALAVIRALGALFVAVATAILLGRWASTRGFAHAAEGAASHTCVVHGSAVDHGHREAGHDHPTHDAQLPTLGERFRCSFAFSFGELFDHVAPWMVMGLFVASLTEPMMQPQAVAELSPTVQVPLLALMGLPMYVCASGAVPTMSVLMHKGLSGGAALAFLVTGPATNLVTFTVLSKLHGRRVAASFWVLVTVLASAIGWATNAWLSPAAVPLHTLSEQLPSWVHLACLALLSSMVLLSVVRQGPRGFIEQLFSVDGYEHEHTHSHDHQHTHDDDCHGHGG